MPYFPPYFSPSSSPPFRTLPYISLFLILSYTLSRNQSGMKPNFIVIYFLEYRIEFKMLSYEPNTT